MICRKKLRNFIPNLQLPVVFGSDKERFILTSFADCYFGLSIEANNSRFPRLIPYVHYFLYNLFSAHAVLTATTVTTKKKK